MLCDLREDGKVHGWCIFVCVCHVVLFLVHNHLQYYFRRYAISTGQAVAPILLESSKLNYWNKKNRLAFSLETSPSAT